MGGSLSHQLGNPFQRAVARRKNGYWPCQKARMMVLIDLKSLYGDTAKLTRLPEYVDQALQQAGAGNEVVLTGAAPVWLYLKVAHALHGKAKRLLYRSPVTGDVVIFDHDPF